MQEYNERKNKKLTNNLLCTDRNMFWVTSSRPSNFGDPLDAMTKLDNWFDEGGLRPVIRGEFEDSALLKVFGQAGDGFFAVPSVIADEVERQYEVEAIGATDDVEERFYAISVERRVRHAAVIAICEAARSELFV